VKADPDPHQSEKPESGSNPHQNEKLNEKKTYEVMRIRNRFQNSKKYGSKPPKLF
jgi:hypothetical protein